MPRTLLSLGKQGYRVIALAFKELSTPAETAKHLKQDDVEADGMTFLGLCVFSSSLKIDAIDTVATLQRANIHVCMITGDHVQTAISVARDCGILNSTRAANTSLSATASFSASSKLYVVDADPMTGDIVIVHDDAEGESCVVTDLTLSEILDQAAAARWLSSRHHFRSFSTRMKNPWAQDSSDDNHRPPHKYTSEEEGAESALMSESSPLISNDFDPSRGPTKTRREALSVEIAVTGKGLKAVMKMHSKSTIDSLIRNSALFSRTKPADKKLIVERLQNMPIFDERVAIVLKSQQPDSAPQSPSKHPHSPLSKRGLGLGGELRYGQAHYESEGEEKVHGERDGSDIFPDVESAMRPSRMTSSSSSGMHSYSLSSKIADHGLPVAGMGVDTTEGHHSNMNAEFAAVRRRGKFHAVFCGDGANDMSALREATIGVSLCDAETSVAAPITSKRAAPRSVIDVIMEGRCSLITAYSLVIFNILYAVIQLNMSCKLYSYALEAGDYMYLIQDMMYSLLSGIVISLAPANEALSADLPPTDFFNAFLVTKLVGQIILFMVFQWAALRLLTEQSWFKPYIPENPLTDTYSYEATTIDCVACAQLVIASIVSTIGMPFRYPWYRSKLMVSVVFVQTAWAIFQIFCTAEISADLMFLQLRPLPTKFAIKLFLLCVGNAVASFAFNGIADAMR
jgi:magnesium-transporting ATPase (P-type)